MASASVGVNVECGRERPHASRTGVRRYLNTRGPGHARQADEKNGDFLHGGHAGAAGEDIVIRALDALEQRVVDGNQHPKRGTAFAINQRQQLIGRAVVVLGAAGHGGQQRALGRRGRRGRRAMQQRIERNSVRREVIERQIDAVARRILAHIAQNVGELEGDAGFLGQFLGALVAVAEDANADQAHDRRDQVAVAVEIGEGCVGVGRAGGRVIEIHGDAGDQLVEQLERNGEARGGIAHGQEDGIGGARCRLPLGAMRRATH